MQWLERIQERYPGYKDIDCFVETGTYQGGTTFKVSNSFKTVHTVELSEQLYNMAKAKAELMKVNNIVFYNGDSGKIIYNLCEQINEPAIFFLDGHYCGDGRGSVKGPEGNPLLKEIAAINGRAYADIIIVDDIWLFGKKVPERNLDWLGITKESIMSRIDKERAVHTFVNDDRFIIYLKEKLQ
jgi:hypothetical protein